LSVVWATKRAEQGWIDQRCEEDSVGRSRACTRYKNRKHYGTSVNCAVFKRRAFRACFLRGAPARFPRSTWHRGYLACWQRRASSRPSVAVGNCQVAQCPLWSKQPPMPRLDSDTETRRQESGSVLTHLFLQQAVQLPLAVHHASSIRRIDDPDDRISLLKVVAPVRSERRLAANVPCVSSPSARVYSPAMCPCASLRRKGTHKC
jgi:hypothetical protein